ncbi:phosphatidylserine/phosphatidylglycerophosphate/cardiolipin synthase family protein [Herbaspirillum sp. VT-16-41]|uniref:phospholipase D-like domain-containing protein n=1 Tax=Herbaspirillum sp. VT-16-41 TaxID=1953765 RepID=UPI0009818046|nr:phospholipase D-like domain-containing protein [Herbaspirillum sp. VT-16-41]ONN67314.1 phospholipase [Herbaspirillum sp. VT-16-41]
MTTTHHPGSVPIDLRKRSATATSQWLLERPEDSNSPIYHANQLEVLICGEEGFARILEDIRNARHSVEIICWGFDPAMELERKGHTWPRGTTWGDLLKDVAAGKYNNGKQVQVRVLCWHENPASINVRNTPGYGALLAPQVERIRHHEQLSGKKYTDGMTFDERRRHFNAMWYFEVTSGAIPSLTFLIRSGDFSDAYSSLAQEKESPTSLTEKGTLALFPTAHQKTVLVDYNYQGGEHAVGYVMGLNSVTDYWDTKKHLFHDPRRGQSWEGGGDELPGLKPFQDYACRINGEVLINVSKNFVDAWNRVASGPQKIAREHDLRSPPAGLKIRAGKSRHRAQIVRTQIEEGDKSIKRLYRQATSFATNYIYIENQYFQYGEWVRYLKQLRRGYVAGWKAAGKPLEELPDLHVFVVIPTPEKPNMVPATHDAVKELGHGTSMPNQDKKSEEKLIVLQQPQELERYVFRKRNNGAPPEIARGPKIPGTNTEPRSNADIAKELEELGIKTLVASLWTYDHAGESKGEKYREIYIHSKLMIIDDAFFTLGSANLNLRSMAIDAEINIGCDDPGLSEKLRREVFAMHSNNAQGCSGGNGSTSEIQMTFNKWQDLLSDNSLKKNVQTPAQGFLMPFRDERTSHLRVA